MRDAECPLSARGGGGRETQKAERVQPPPSPPHLPRSSGRAPHEGAGQRTRAAPRTRSGWRGTAPGTWCGRSARGRPAERGGRALETSNGSKRSSGTSALKTVAAAQREAYTSPQKAARCATCSGEAPIDENSPAKNFSKPEASPAPSSNAAAALSAAGSTSPPALAVQGLNADARPRRAPAPRDVPI